MARPWRERPWPRRRCGASRAERGGPMFELKPLSKEAIPRALEKAQRYRLISEPVEPQSICLDVLRIDPENESALVCLLLALTDQFDEEIQDAVVQAREVLPRLRDGYSRAYYAGIICERRAKAQLKHGGPRSRYAPPAALPAAPGWDETAGTHRPPGDSARL